MKTISLDLRERIVAAYDGEEGTREEVAKRFRVSVGMVKKLRSSVARPASLATATGTLGARPRSCRSIASGWAHSSPRSRT